MSAAHHRLLWLWGGLLAALLCLLFLPLTGGERGFAILLVAAAVTAGLVVAGRRPGESAEGEYGLNDLPDTPYRLPVVLVCGDTGDWPGESTVHRTAQGCWLKVSTVQLQQTVRHLLWRRPELVSQLAVMVCVCPQQHDDGALLTARLHELRWQLTRVRRDARRQVPLLLSGTLAGRAVTAPVWQSALPGEAIQVWQDGEAPQSAGVWLLQDAPPARLRTQILFSAHARFVSEEILPVLTGDNPDSLDLHQVSEENQVILSVLDNMQRILNCRAGTLAHLPDYGLPDMTKILQGMPGTAHELMGKLSTVLLKYEPRLQRLTVVLLEQTQPGELRYAIDAELKGVGLVRYGTEFMPEGKILIRHMKQQHYLDARAAI
ncbi:type VI secretion system baseplate subunit TssE [Klebsiella michiganensis]|nr:putative type VI secretion system lysozyme-like protein [Klebsiella sp. OBRC7]